MPELRIPLATYRIQFSLGFRYLDGRDLVPYLNDLGITDLYSSPRFKARRGSPHAYDVANPTRINSELGTEKEFAELSAKLRAYNMGLVLDIVPNHMAASPENPWWMDVLENGRGSIYARYFAVDWCREVAKARRRPRILLAILRDLYGKVLESGELSLKLDENGFFVRYYDHRLPLDPKSYRLLLEPSLSAARTRGDEKAAAELSRLMAGFDELPGWDCEDCEERHRGKELLKAKLWETYNSVPEMKTHVDEALIAASGIPGVPESFDLLDRILDEQHYRIAFWRTAAEELNYRRFFDITDLVGMRVEDKTVFDARHSEVLRIVANGDITGLRVDHVDGLWDPEQYLAWLRQATVGGNDSGRGCSEFYTVAEKILAADEELPPEWHVCGTTGYKFLNWLNALFVDREGLARMDAFYREFTGIGSTMGDVLYASKKKVMQQLFPGEVRALGYHLGRLAAVDRMARDLPFDSLLEALVEVTAWLNVYRTYIRSLAVTERDRGFIERALAAAEKALPGSDPEVFAFVRRVLLLEVPRYAEHPQDWLGFVMGWQQFTGPCMAKGFEDTACYVYNRLVSQNEVGGGPELADNPPGPEGFHAWNRKRKEHWPHSMIATTTHDTKRSEDVRARINVLPMVADEWAEAVRRWAAMNERHKADLRGAPAPDRNDEYLLYQTLVGAWPLCAEDMPEFRDRIRNYMQKAVREAKVHSDWINPDEGYEEAVLRFVDAVLGESGGNDFLSDFAAFHKRIAPAGAVNSLAQVLLKICSPGVPDFYQGTELWNLSLVDPDNRRPVDFQKRVVMLDEIRRLEGYDLGALLEDITTNWTDGRVKLYTTYKALTFRRQHAELFQTGEYLPIEAPASVCAFARRRGEEWAVAVAPRLVGARQRLLDTGAHGDGRLHLPDGAPAKWRNVFTAEEGESLRFSDLFGKMPVALLEAVS